MQIKMTGLLALTAVPLNTLFGVVAAIQITRNNFWGKSVLISLLDLPFSISPVVAGVNDILDHFHPIGRLACGAMCIARPRGVCSCITGAGLHCWHCLIAAAVTHTFWKSYHCNAVRSVHRLT